MNDDATNLNQEVRTTRKKRTMNDVSKDSQEDNNLPDGPHKAKERGGPDKRQWRSASPMPPPATKKRVQTNSHPGLIGKKTRRTKAEIAADKAIKESEAAIAAAVEEKTLVRLADIELEQERAEKTRLQGIIRKRPAAATNTTDAWEDGNPTGMMDVDSAEDLTHLMDVDDSGDSDCDDDDQSESDATKKVTLPGFD